MMDYPLTVLYLLDRAARYFPRAKVVSRGPDRSLAPATPEVPGVVPAKGRDAIAVVRAKPGQRASELVGAAPTTRGIIRRAAHGRSAPHAESAPVGGGPLRPCIGPAFPRPGADAAIGRATTVTP